MTAASTTNAPEQLPPGLRISASEQGTTSTIAVEGEWDLAQQIASTDAIDHALDRRPACLVLDLSQLSFIDSSRHSRPDQRPQAQRRASNPPRDHPRPPRRATRIRNLRPDRDPTVHRTQSTSPTLKGP